MREIDVSEISAAVKRLCIEANRTLPDDMCECIKKARSLERSPVGRGVFDDILDNLEAAKEETLPICQDTGMAVIFLEIGQDVHLVGGELYNAVNRGVADGYTEGLLRKSIVSDPLSRINTGDNTPAVIHTDIVSGDRIKIVCAPKGFGSENMSALKMFTPSASQEDITDFVTEVSAKAGSNPCPPTVIGVGIGGNFESCAYLAKKALCRSVSVRNEDPVYAGLEEKMLRRINMLGIGPQGFGGTVTCLAVNIEKAPTHIAGLPVAVNVGCHVTRHAGAII